MSPLRRVVLPCLFAVGGAAVVTAPATAASAPAAPTPPAPFAYTSDRDGDAEIWFRSRLGVQVKLTDNGAQDLDPSYRGDGQAIAFTSDRDGDEEIFTMTATGGRVRQLTFASTDPDGAPAQDGQPAWSPDGTRIAFVSTRTGGAPKVWIMNADGSGQRQLTVGEPFQYDAGPTWTPDGRALLFASNREGDGNFELYRIRPDGSGLTRLTFTEGDVSETNPDVSPDGAWVVYNRSGGDDVVQHLYRMPLTGGPAVQLTDDPTRDDVFPAWTPDGARILFNTFGNELTGEDGEIWSVRFDGTGRRALTNDPGTDFFPDPRPALAP